MVAEGSESDDRRALRATAVSEGENMERERGHGAERAGAAPDAAETTQPGLRERALAGDPAAMRAVQRRLAARREREAGEGAEGPQRIEGDEMVLQVGVDDQLQDAEAEAARQKLQTKIQRTQEAIEKGARDALQFQMGVQSEEKHEALNEKALEAVKDPLKEKIAEFVKGKAFQAAKVKGGGAVGKRMKNALASEGSHIAGKVMGAAAVVGAAKDVVDAVGEAEVADFTASTWHGLMKEIDQNVPPAFDGYRAIVRGMDAQTAIDAAAGETVEPWISAAHVKEQLIRLFNAAMVEASATGNGPYKGRQLFDKVQETLHPKADE